MKTPKSIISTLSEFVRIYRMKKGRATVVSEDGGVLEWNWV
jgi:3-oxoacyl-[acyl-carrier-protein] synthase III